MDLNYGAWDNVEFSTIMYIKNLSSYQKILNNLFEKNNQYSNVNSFYFKNFALTTFFAQIFTTFEYNLTTICDKIQECNHEKFYLKDIKGSNDLDKAKTYILKTVGVDISTYENWAQLKNLQQVRHCIVHNHCIYPKDAPFKKMLEESEGIIFNSTNDNRDIFSMNDNKFNTQFIQLIRSFFDKLYKDVYSHYNVQIK
ncbi:MAG: hypothetical protein ABI367_08560 [Mucilaginibacter sp.]